MARAVRYFTGRSHTELPRSKRTRVGNIEARERAIAAHAAREAARRADPRVKKSTAKRVEEEVVREIDSLPYSRQEGLRDAARLARKAAKGVGGKQMGVRSQTIIRMERSRQP